MNQEEFTRLHLLVGRNRGPVLLWDAFVGGQITKETLAAVIGDVWSDAELPERLLRPRSAWLFLFKMAGYTVNGRPASRPVQAVNLYRGATPRYARRMAWSADPERAEWFAARVRLFGYENACVYTSEVPPESLLCRLHDPVNGRGEDEYVIDPAGINITRALAEVSADAA